MGILISYSVIIDIANLIFFIGGLTQMRSTFINRKNKEAKSVSYLMLTASTIASLMFAVGNSHFGAYIGAILNCVSASVFMLQIIWKLRK
jgi:uncharacterized protein with PQ loop repeat